MKNYQVIIFLVAISLSALSCVSSKKFEQANAELSQLQSVNTEQSQKIANDENEMVAMKSTNQKLMEESTMLKKEMQACNQAKETATKNLAALKGTIEEQHGSLRQLNDKAKAGLEKFEAAGIDVNMVDGLVHLSMDNGLMFTSGGTTVGWEGKQALAVVAEVLNDFPGTDIYVIGNTDNTPAGKGYTDNWSLSTTRANAVVRVLCDDYKVDAKRIISGGRAQYHPAADNTTEDGKMKNRRIDIFVNPNLEKMWKTVETIK